MMKKVFAVLMIGALMVAGCNTADPMEEIEVKITDTQATGNDGNDGSDGSGSDDPFEPKKGQ